jgi:hypothetical protein
MSRRVTPGSDPEGCQSGSKRFFARSWAEAAIGAIPGWKAEAFHCDLCEGWHLRSVGHKVTR